MTKVRNEAELKRLIDKGIENGIKKIGIMLEAKSKSLAPVDTGLLKSKIYHKIEKDKIILGCGVDYSEAMEYGTKNYWVGTPDNPKPHDTYQRTGKGSAVGYSPFLRPAVHQLRPKFAEIIKEEIARSLS